MGYYQACERIDDTALAPVGERVAGKLKDGFKDAIAFVVCPFRDLKAQARFNLLNIQIDGEKLGSGEAALVVRPPLHLPAWFLFRATALCLTRQRLAAILG